MVEVSVKPDFFLVGAPKCGTTALFQYLCLHPDVYSPATKEPNYFCTDFPGLRGPDTEEKYRSLYREAAGENKYVGDASVVYMYSEVALQAIRAFNPAAKIIIMLRNPVDMVYSLHSQYLYTLNEDVEDFETAWNLQQERLAGRALPATCLEPHILQYESMGRMSVGVERALQAFPASQVKILLIDDIKSAPQEAFNDVLNFLGLAPFVLDEFPVVNANKTNKSKWVALLTQRGAPAWLKKPVRSLKTALGLGHVSLSGKLDALNKTHQQRSPMSTSMRETLTRLFADEIDRLEALSGRDLSHWRSRS